MRKLCVIFLVVLLLILSINSSFASIPLNKLIEKQNNIEEKKVILRALENSKTKPKEILFEDRKNFKFIKDLNIKSPDDFVYGEPFKVFYFSDINNSKENFRKFLKGDKLYRILSNTPYYWEIPVLFKENNTLKPISSVVVNRGTTTSLWGGDWDFAQMPSYLDPETSYLCSQPDKLAKLLTSKGIPSNADIFMNITIGDFYNFLYVSANEKEYFIPLGDGLGTKKFDVYTRSEFQPKLGPYMEKALNNEPLPTLGLPDGKVKNTFHNLTTISIYIVAIVVVLLVSGFIYYLYNKKAYHKTR